MRKRPYTAIGIRRLGCYRCGRPSKFQWQVCADNNVFRPICEDCDIALNALVLSWMGDSEAEAKMKVYTEKVRGEAIA